MMESVSLPQARRAVLAAQGFLDRKPTGTPDRRHLARVLDRIGLLQMDSVNVLARAHYMPLFSRLGPYPMALLEQAAWSSKRSLFEYWAHEASLLPMALHPLLRWRMQDAQAGQGVWRQVAEFGRTETAYVAAILARIRDDGAMPASALEGPKGAGGWWAWSHAKRALEYLFWTGQVTTAGRTGFARVYDVPERVIPAAILATPTPARDAAQRALVRIAAAALGVATAADLRDYFRLPAADMAPRIAELAEAGDLIEIRVRGWDKPAYITPQTVFPRSTAASALLSPFDPLIWDRARTERLFGFHYRIEIYTPAHKRVHGYYVLPFMLHGALVARLDLKAQRQESALAVLAAHREPEAPADTAAHLAAELRRMATWLGLQRITVAHTGDFATGLVRALSGKTT